MIWRVFLAVLLIVLPATAQATWSRAASEHFIAYGETDPERLRTFIDKVERYDALLRLITKQGEEASPNKLILFVVRDIAAVQKIMGQGSRNVAGFYAPSVSGSFAVVPRGAGSGGQFDLDAETVLFHEYAHHFMLQYFPVAYPAWFVEGFAEYYSTVDFRTDGTIRIGYPAQHRFYALAGLTAFPLKRMFAADAGRMTAEETDRFYSWAWLLTHYLRFAPDRRGQLEAYLKAFASGTAPDEAASKAFGDIAALQANLGTYLKSHKLSYYEMKGVTFTPKPITATALGPAETQLMPLYMRFVRGSRSAEEVADFARDARAAAQRFPDNAMALESLAEGELDAEQYDAASKANDALIALRPTDNRALLRRARIATARLGDSHDEGGWKAVRILIAKANRAAPDDPFPLVEYYRSFDRAGLPPPQIAIDGLDRALQLAPQVADVRLTLGARLIKQKKRDLAAVILAPLLNEPHSPGLRDAARALLEPSPPPPVGKPGTEDTAKPK